MGSISEGINNLFGPPLRALFHPTNAMFSAIPDSAAPYVAKAAAASLFLAGMAFVFFLRREYVNLDAPGKKPWHDLRLWTVVSMTPHIFVYLWF